MGMEISKYLNIPIYYAQKKTEQVPVSSPFLAAKNSAPEISSVDSNVQQDNYAILSHYYPNLPSYYFNKNKSSAFSIQESAPQANIRRNVTEIPDITKADKSKNWLFDTRGADLTKFDLSNQIELLRYADFDNRTIFPTGEKAPKNFNPEKVLEDNKNPGLGVKEMHKKGYTGKGTRVAIIDQPLATGHNEFKDKIVHYEQIGYPKGSKAEMHGSAVTSILAGDTVGVAPESEIVYFAANSLKTDGKNFETYNANYTKALKKIQEMNKTLPPDKKISAVSISWGFNEKADDYKELEKTIKELENSGVFVISTALSRTHNLDFMGLSRDPQKNQDDIKSYSPGLFWKDKAEKHTRNNLLVPMDHRTTASPTGADDYVHYANGGHSWAVPYIAGLYAVAKQADKSITPQKFWEKALETGNTLTIENGKSVGQIVSPLELVESLKQNK